ncbi:MAG: FAD-dependent oxidoreductase [Candidatus Riflebacteria bacterium]|nr:FAD-dependent oxidoreductase [Candidatus Riflebacteria bacterium]
MFRDTSRWWGWGDPAAPSLLAERPDLASYLGDRLRLEGAAGLAVPEIGQIELPGSRLDEAVRQALQRVLGPDGLDLSHEGRLRHCAGKSYVDLVRLRKGTVAAAPDAVAHPTTTDQVAALLALAAHHDLAVVPFGGGTSVVGGVAPIDPVARRPVLTIDLRSLDRVVEVDPVSRTATVEAGILGPALEASLESHGLTVGHFPQSFEFSTLGGWIATRSAGQCSTGYGRADERVLSLDVAVPGRRIETAPPVPAAVGPSICRLLVGSEGVLGVITSARLALLPVPEERCLSSFFFGSWAEGLDALRELMRSGPVPTMVRLSDPEETRTLVAGAHRPRDFLEATKRRLGLWLLKRSARDRSSPCLMIVDFEGTRREARAARSRAVSMLKGRALLAAGESPARTWLNERFRHPYLRDDLLGRGVLVETLETATTWTQLPDLYQGVRDRLERAFAEADVPGLVFCHLSHAYTEGASLYFSILARAVPGQEIQQWRALKQAATEEIVARQAALSHHHGVGVDHAPWLERQIGAEGMSLLRALKRELDPRAILNPGKLLPEGGVGLSLPDRAGTAAQGPDPEAPPALSSATRQAHLERAVADGVDVLIIGGGINGVCVARDAAMRGLSVLVVEQAQFASGTSSRSSKLIHGGLRYLEHLELGLVFESLTERDRLLSLAPNLVRPVGFLIPVYEGDKHSLWEVDAGLWIYDLMSLFRMVKRHNRMNADAVTAQMPGLRAQGLKGGVIYDDATTDDACLTMAILRSAVTHGALAVNRARVVALGEERSRIATARIEDTLTGEIHMIRARAVVNTAGPWVDAVRRLARPDAQPLLRPTKGAHAVFSGERVPLSRAVVMVGRGDGRAIFMLPWLGYTLLGTTDTDFTGDPSEATATHEDLVYLLETANYFFPDLSLTPADVIGRFAGLRPLVADESSDVPSDISRRYSLTQDAPGLFTLTGGKLTTARRMAEDTLDLVLKSARIKAPRRCWTARESLLASVPFDALVDELKAAAPISPESARFLAMCYGSDARHVVRLMVENPPLAERIVPGHPHLRAQVVFGLRHELLATPGDFLDHYGKGGLGVTPGAAECVARVMAENR